MYSIGTNYSGSQFEYTLDFQDLTPESLFVVSPESKCYIYRFDGSTKYYIHQDFFSVQDNIKVQLEYGERYWIGLRCDKLYVPFLQYVDTALDGTIYGSSLSVHIYPIYNNTYFINDYITVSTIFAGNGDGCWVNYTDYTGGTDNVTIRFYQVFTNNETQILKNTYVFATSNKNYHWTTAAGCNTSVTYMIELSINHSLFSTIQYFISHIYSFITPVWNVDWINAAFITVFGKCPLSPVSWTQAITFFVFFLCLVTFGSLYSELGVIFTSVVVILIEVVLLDNPIYRGLIVGVMIFLALFSAIVYSKSRGMIQ
jgi:hypothetical protein